jgi:hypothetical protein
MMTPNQLITYANKKLEKVERGSFTFRLYTDMRLLVPYRGVEGVIDFLKEEEEHESKQGYESYANVVAAIIRDIR